MDDVRDALLPALAAATCSHLAIHHQISMTGDVQEYGLPWPGDHAALADALRCYPAVMEHSPLLQYFSMMGGPGVVSVAQLMSRRQWRENPVYKESHGALGVDDHLAVLLNFHPRAMYGITVARQGRDYTQRDRDLMLLLSPHLRSALTRSLANPAPYLTIRALPTPTVVWRAGPALAPDEAPPPLTSREQEVLALVSSGMGVRRAARVLDISARTVDKHLENTYRKLGATTYAEATARLRATPRER